MILVTDRYGVFLGKCDQDYKYCYYHLMVLVTDRYGGFWRGKCDGGSEDKQLVWSRPMWEPHRRLQNGEL